MLDEDKNNLKRNINKKNLFHLTIDLHNTVNSRTYKKIWGHVESDKYYKSFFLNFETVKKFLHVYVYYNFKKGPVKTEKLFEMLKSFSHIFPRYHVRQKLIDFQDKVKPNKDNFQKWITAYILIIRKEMR